MPEHGISIVYHCTGNVPAAIDVASRIGLIVNELVANSVEHAFRDPFPRDRSGEITIRVERDPSNGIGMMIADNGIGYRPDADDTVGMTTARRLVAQLGASLERISEGGTRWEIRVPSSVLQTAALQEAAPPERPTPS